LKLHIITLEMRSETLSSIIDLIYRKINKIKLIYYKGIIYDIQSMPAIIFSEHR